MSLLDAIRECMVGTKDLQRILADAREEVFQKQGDAAMQDFVILVTGREWVELSRYLLAHPVSHESPQGTLSWAGIRLQRVYTIEILQRGRVIEASQATAFADPGSPR